MLKEVGGVAIQPRHLATCHCRSVDGFNVGFLVGINPFAIPDIPVNDGVNHPADRVQD